MKEDLPHILVVDDDERIRQLLKRYLTAQSMTVVTAADAQEARNYLKELTFDLITLDIMMPGESGLNLSRYIKDSTNIPIILLTARADVEERIEGLSTGADDYLPKPFEPKELVLRIEAILRRTQANTSTSPSNPKNTETIKIGSWAYHPQQKRLCRDCKENSTNDKEEIVILTDTELLLLNSLLKRPNTPIRRDILAQQSGIDAQDRAVDVQITRLRKKIEDDPKTPILIQTVRGQGYLVNIS
jgi:two-component system phosphate regulon response regulator OmpR